MLNNKVKIISKKQFMNQLSRFDGEAKIFESKGTLYMIDSYAVLPNYVNWDYVFLDEIECVDFKKLGLD